MRRRGRDQYKGVFCLEGVWWPRQRHHDTIEPMLRLLKEGHWGREHYAHYRIPNHVSLEHMLKDWCRPKYDSYPILMLAFHGHPGEIVLGGQGRDRVKTIDWLADRLEDRCRGRVIHFATCATIDLHGQVIRNFQKRTGALVVSGYRQYVDWIDATALDLMYLTRLQTVNFTLSGARLAKRQMKERHGNTMRTLGFDMWIDKTPHRR